MPHPLIALLPLVVVGVMNKLLTVWIPGVYGENYSIDLAHNNHAVTGQVKPVVAIWAVEAALLLGIVTVLLFAFRTVSSKFAEGTKSAIGGALLASMNTASEYGFGAVIAALPGFIMIADALRQSPIPLVNEAITVSTAGRHHRLCVRRA